MLRAQCGDREALESLLREVQPGLLGYISRLAGRDAAEDILQDVFLQVIRKLVFLREPELFRAWAYRIAGRAAFAFLKRKRRYTERHDDGIVLEEMPSVLENDVVGKELFAEMTARIDQLSPASRAVLHLHYTEERPLDEVAAILEISLGTAKSRLAYGLSCLRKQIEQERQFHE